MRIFLPILLFFAIQMGAQSLHVANSYYKQGQFDNAVLAYEAVLKKYPNNFQVVLGLAKSYRQTEQFPKAVLILKESYAKQPNKLEMLLELGVTYNHMKKEELAITTFDRIITALDEHPNYAPHMGRSFKEYNLLTYTIKCFEKATSFNPNYNYRLEIGRLYGEIGDLEGMFDSYLTYIITNPNNINAIKRFIDEFITDDPENEANEIFRRTLLKKNQAKPDVLYNEMLAWLFVQQKQYRKAFAQERAIYRQTESGIPQILDLGNIAREGKDEETAEEAYLFVLENTDVNSFKIKANQALLDIEKARVKPSKYPSINKKYIALFNEFKEGPESLPLYLDYAYFLGFKQNKKEEAIRFLKPLSKKKFSAVDKAKIQLLIGDVLVLDSKFNQALVYYTKAQKRVKNHPLSQEASFKIAKTSYYKGDFNWANTQLNVLKESTTQLVANDAMNLSLCIYDNTQDESDEGDAALKLFAKATLYEFQEQYDKALETYDVLLEKHQGYSVEDDVLFAQGKLYIKKNQYDKALANFEKLIQFFPLSLLVDDTYFELGQLYESLENIVEAKQAYEKIIFNHADSIHFVEARKAYRRLRGDKVVN